MHADSEIQGPSVAPKFTRLHRLTRILPALSALLVALVAFWQFSDALHESPFHPDESRWINRAPYVRELLHPLSDFWADSYLIRGQPPMGSYITGFGLLLQGKSLDVNEPWNFVYGNDGDINWNVTHGNTPTSDTLIAARRTALFLGIVLCLSAWLIVTMLSNWFGGVVAGIFLALNPLTIYLATLAVSDMQFTVIVALSVLAAIAIARNPTWPRIVLLGILLGAGAALKLSPIFVAFGLAVVGGLIICTPIALRIPGLRWVWTHFGADDPKVQRMGWMMLALPVIAGTFFIASYPYLWSDPVGRTKVLFDFRRTEMESQSRIWGDQAIHSREQAVRDTWDMLEHRYSTSGRILVRLGITAPTPSGQRRGIDLPFAIAGVLIFVALALMRGFRTPHLMAWLVLAGQIGIILLGININFNRYYLPVAFFFSIGLGIGAATLVHFFGRLWAFMRSRRAVPPNVSSQPVSTAPSA